MSIEAAIRATEILLALAFIQQSIEQLRDAPPLFGARILASVVLLFGIAAPLACLLLLGIGIVMLHRFNGPYNGGSDRMSLLILVCLTAAHLVPSEWREAAIGYLAVQLILSYVISGWVKIVNPEWRCGRALSDVFRFSAYPVSERLRELADRPRLLFAASWAVMLFEMLFPLTLWFQVTLFMGLGVAALFHLANACLFGLNRFLWIWIAAYPSIIWFQDRIFGA